MAISMSIQDLENYPGVTKKVSIDLSSIIPVGNEGDEVFVLSAYTSAYSDTVNKTAISDLYVTDINTGWCKSSGLVGDSGKFSIDDTHYSLKIKIDTTVSGTDGSGYYTINLTPNEDNTPISGEDIAVELEKKIRVIADNIGVEDYGFYKSYKNASVEYTSGKFWIVSGSMAKNYTGNYRSAVEIMPADTNDCSSRLGFNLQMTSAYMATIAVKEVLLSYDYTAGTDTLLINTGTGASANSAFMITDGNNTDYFTSLSGTLDSSIKVASIGSNGFSGISNSYIAGEAKVQLLKEQDVDNKPYQWFNSIDKLVRYGVKVISNQIDYSS